MASLFQTPNGLLFLLFIVQCTGHYYRTALSNPAIIGGCSLNPAMDVTSCRSPEDKHVEGNRGLFGNTNEGTRERGVVLKVHDDVSSETVVQGTTCSLIPAYSSTAVYRCRNGAWTTLDPEVPSPSKTKRSIRSRLTTKRVCRKRCYWFRSWRKCQTCCYTYRIRNYYPVIKCPKIDDVYADIRQTAQVVQWDKATATDKEDGEISTHQTFGPHPNTVLQYGTYYVSYQAKDKQGLTAWCAEKFKVKVRTCPGIWRFGKYYLNWLYWFPHGNVDCSHRNIYGSVCTFSCDNNYELSGPATLECQENGEWSDERPTCVEQQCPDPPLVDNGQWTACSRRTPDSTCTLACDTGYNIEGSTTITCQDDRTWTTPGTCKDAEAPEIVCPANISVFSMPQKQPVQVSWETPTATDNTGDDVTVTSDYTSGQLFPVGTTLVTFTAKDSSGNTAFCSMTVEVNVQYCPSLSPISNGQFSCSHGNAEGSECSFTCSENFELNGSSTITCLTTLEWSDNPPTCESRSCDSPLPEVENGMFSCPDGNGFGETCTLVCSAGYTANPPLIITCNTALQWSTAGSCSDTQPPTFPNGCPDIARYAANLAQHTNVFFNNPEATDNSGEMVTVTSSIPSGSSFEIGSTNVTFTAVDASGNEANCTVTVQVTQVTCPDPENTDLDTSRDKVMEFNCPDGHVAGAQCCISCSDDSPLSGPPVITCFHNGTSGIGYWYYGDVPPVCNAETCPEPEIPANGALACDMLADREFCVVQCQEGYAFPRTDLENGGFLCVLTTGEWSPRAITSDLCIAGRPADGVELMPDIYYFSDSCSSDNEEIKKNFVTIVESLSVFTDLCENNEVSCELDSVTVTCGERSKRSVGAVSDGFDGNRNPRNKRSLDLSKALSSDQELLRSKRASDLTHRTIIAFTIKMSYVRKATAEDTASFYDGLANSLNDFFLDAVDDGTLAIPEAGETDPFSYGFGLAGYVCSAPTQFQAQSTLCVGCGQGYIYVSQSEPCSVCPLGTYQPEDEGTECLPCPDGFTTRKTASKSEDDCLAICLPGKYSRTGLQPCDRCRKGSYQAGTGKTSCDLCPYGMSTASDGASSMDDCKFYEVKFNNASNSVDFSEQGEQLSDFTVVAWVKSPSDLIDTETSFSLTKNNGDASFGCGDFTVFISASKNTERKNRRQWNHIVMTHSSSMATLYVNGVQKESKTVTAFCTDYHLTFINSVMLSDLTLSGLQVSGNALTSEDAESMSTSCNQMLEGNILTQTEEEAESLLTPSTCDDVDNCINNPCGLKGVCIDLMDTYRCECLDNFVGDNCEVAPVIDYCENIQCENNGDCVNQPQHSNYTCVCPQGYRGRLCSEKIVDGGWSQFTEWSQCSVTCGRGTQSRSRTCDNPSPGLDGKMCEGDNEETLSCTQDSCPVNGGLSAWTEWACTVTCGEGTSTRTRECNNPTPASGGNDCVGALTEAKDCENLEPCPVDGAYGNFSDWSECSETCGGGVTIRERTCDSPAPQNGGATCDPDLATESRSCNEEDCPTCRRLTRPAGNVDTLNCTTNDTDDMTVCSIVCKTGYVTDQDKTFMCGRATNYTWSHVTENNPRGLLPDCEEADFPTNITMRITAVYEGSDLDPETLTQSLESRLNETISCSNCTYTVVSSETISSKKRATNGVETSIVLTGPLLPEMDLMTASDSDLDEQVKLIMDFDQAAQQFANNSDYIFALPTDDTTLMPDLESVSEEVETGCPAGTESLNEVCANCGAGYYSISVDSKCESCPKGFYQNNIKSTSCKTCPAGTSTAGVGAQSLEQCVEDPSVFFPDYIDIVPIENPETTTTDVEQEREENGKSDHTSLIAGSVGGSVALVLLVLLLIIIFFKCCRNEKKNPSIYSEESRSSVHNKYAKPKSNPSLYSEKSRGSVQDKVSQLKSNPSVYSEKSGSSVHDIFAQVKANPSLYSENSRNPVHNKFAHPLYI